jgi:hypothetical protein
MMTSASQSTRCKGTLTAGKAGAGAVSTTWRQTSAISSSSENLMGCILAEGSQTCAVVVGCRRQPAR